MFQKLNLFFNIYHNHCYTWQGGKQKQSLGLKHSRTFYSFKKQIAYHNDLRNTLVFRPGSEWHKQLSEIQYSLIILCSFQECLLHLLREVAWNLWHVPWQLLSFGMKYIASII